jgi:hypothetical protein
LSFFIYFSFYIIFSIPIKKKKKKKDFEQN